MPPTTDRPLLQFPSNLIDRVVGELPSVERLKSVALACRDFAFGPPVASQTIQPTVAAPHPCRCYRCSATPFRLLQFPSPLARMADDYTLLAEILDGTRRLTVLTFVGFGRRWADLPLVLRNALLGPLSTADLRELKIGNIMDLPLSVLPVLSSAAKKLATVSVAGINSLPGPLAPSRSLVDVNVHWLDTAQIRFLTHPQMSTFFAGRLRALTWLSEHRDNERILNQSADTLRDLIYAVKLRTDWGDLCPEYLLVTIKQIPTQLPALRSVLVRVENVRFPLPSPGELGLGARLTEIDESLRDHAPLRRFGFVLSVDMQDPRYPALKSGFQAYVCGKLPVLHSRELLYFRDLTTRVNLWDKRSI
ncbi:hypothetical protein DFH09DRAFT_1439422 [Mycena vulgaris]|nr:hypothetical protein DFH09DRAFT_1439422 [Mycena vulgaris]